MTAEPAPEIKVQVDRVLASIDVPSFELNLKEVPEDDGPPVKTIKLSQALFEKFARESNFYAIASVQVRDLNHRVYSATLMDDEDLCWFAERTARFQTAKLLRFAKHLDGS